MPCPDLSTQSLSTAAYPAAQEVRLLLPFLLRFLLLFCLLVHAVPVAGGLLLLLLVVIVMVALVAMISLWAVRMVLVGLAAPKTPPALLAAAVSTNSMQAHRTAAAV